MVSISFYICKGKNRQKSSTSRGRSWTFAFGARSLFRRRSKNKRGHGTDDDVQGRRIVCLGESHAFTHVREGHAPVDVAHTRMARRRTNQYQAIPGVHPNRRDRQSQPVHHQPPTTPFAASVLSITFLQRRKSIVWTIIRTRKLSSSPASLHPACEKSTWEEFKRYTVKRMNQWNELNLDKADGERHPD